MDSGLQEGCGSKLELVSSFFDSHLLNQDQKTNEIDIQGVKPGIPDESYRFVYTVDIYLQLTAFFTGNVTAATSKL